MTVFQEISQNLRRASAGDLFTDAKANNFDLIRLIAALMVIYGHSYAISPKPGHTDLITRATGGIAFGGSVAVAVFFFLSGALVTRSMVESSTPWSFALKRVARIWPALTACVLISALVFAPLFGGGTIDKAQLLSYILKNVGNFYSQHFVSGVYDNHPNPSLNGSLWSLTLEARLYFVWFLAMLIGLHKSRTLLNLSLICLVVHLVVQPATVVLLGSDVALYAGIPGFPFHSLIFVAGALFFLNGGGRFNYFYVACIALLIFRIAIDPNLKACALWVTVIALALFFAGLPLLHKIKLPGDYSYGVYLYGWPAQQIIYSCAPNLSPEWNFLFSAVIAAVAGCLSWHLLEKPVLDKVRGKRSTPPLMAGTALSSEHAITPVHCAT